MQNGKGRGLDKKGRRLFKKIYGQIPSGFHIHHKDGDHTNNSLDNLILMRGSDHLSWHNLKTFSEDMKKNWNNRPKWARHKELSSGPFVCVINEDGSSKIMFKPYHVRESAEIWSNKGDNFFELKNYKEALKCYNEVLKLDPAFADSWYFKGVSLYNQGKFTEAIKCFKSRKKTIKV